MSDLTDEPHEITDEEGIEIVREMVHEELYGTACACLNVTFKPKDVEHPEHGMLKQEHWECNLCGREFSPGTPSLRSKLTEAERKLEESEKTVAQLYDHGYAQPNAWDKMNQRATVAEAGEAALREAAMEAWKFLNETEASAAHYKNLTALLSKPSPGVKIFEALEPFAKAADCIDPEAKDEGSVMDLWDQNKPGPQGEPDVRLAYGDFRKARAALRGSNG